MKPTRRLSLERLEDRTVPALFGVPWADAQNLTLSFATDGTQINASASNLFSLLNKETTTATWQKEILRAFQTWAVNANVNIGVIADNGSAFGAAGPVQGNTGVGDIRIGATKLTPGVLALTVPPNLATTWSGDVLLNNTQDFAPGCGSGCDLYSVLLQEAGHAFGLGNSSDPDSPLYELYQGERDSLTEGDIASIQALYGSRKADRFEGTTNNNDRSRATAIGFIADPTSASAASNVVEADITKLSDKDFFKFTATTGTFQVSLKTSGLSLLQARLRVFDAAGNRIAGVTATDPLTGDLTLTINGTAGATYSACVDAGTTEVFGIGRYRLAVGVDASKVIQAPPSSALIAADAGSNNTLATATVLSSGPTKVNERLDYSLKASLDTAFDSDYYKVTVPTTGSAANMFVSAWYLDSKPFAPMVQVLDAAGKTVASRIVSSSGSSVKVEVLNVQSGATYYVKVANFLTTGNYQLAVDFRGEEAALTSFVSGDLTASAPTNYQTLEVKQKQMFHFDLSAFSESYSGSSSVQMTIFDANKQVVSSLTAFGGSSKSVDLWLEAGTYTVRFTLKGLFGGTPQALSFDLRGYVCTDPIGLTPDDTACIAVGTTGGEAPGDYYLGNSYSFYTPDPALVNAYLTVQDPYTTSWWY